MHSNPLTFESRNHAPYEQVGQPLCPFSLTFSKSQVSCLMLTYNFVCILVYLGNDLKVENLEANQCKSAVGETFPNHLAASSPGQQQSHVQNDRTLSSSGSILPRQTSPEKMVPPSKGRPICDKDIKQEPLTVNERGNLPHCKSTSESQGGGILPYSAAALLSSRVGKPSQFEGFAQEFHQSVLRTTQESMAHQRVGTSSQNNSAQTETTRRDRLVSLTNNEGAVPRSNAAVCSKGQFQWPGVETVMDSFQRYTRGRFISTFC